MNLLHLEYFYRVATEGGFLRASEKMRIQQSAISRMVGQLEEAFGFKLFEKVGRNVQLTERGQEVYQYAQRIFNEVNALQVSLGQISGECRGPLPIAAAESVASYFLPGPLSQLLNNFPAVHPHIFSGPASLLLKQIESGEIELGFFFHIPELREKLILQTTLPITFKLVVHKDFRKNQKVLESFIGSREMDDSRTREFPTLEKLKSKYPQAQIKISSNNLTMHKEFVLRGQGVAILPEFLIHNEWKQKLFVDVLPQEKFVFHLKIIRRKNAVLSLNATKLLEQLAP